MTINKTYVVPHPPLIVPHVGRGQEKRIQKTVDAFDEVARRIAAQKPDTVVIITPHSVMYGDYIHISPGYGAHGDFCCFGAKGESFYKDYDSQFVSELSKLAFDAEIPAGTLGEKSTGLDHATLVPMYFINKYLDDYKIVRISISGLPYVTHYRLGQLIEKAAQELGKNTVVVASGDLSHRLTDSGPYDYAEEGPEFDEKVTDALKAADFLKLLELNETFCEAAGECGLRSFIMMAGVLDGRAVEADFLSYEGPFGVGYAVCEFTTGEPDDSRKFVDVYEGKQKEELESIKQKENDYVKLARQTLETYVKQRRYIEVPEDISEELTEKKAGVFVSLKKHGRLRGCIGTIEPTKKSIAKEIITNAVSAGTGDPRFEPVTEDELCDLVYSVDVLGEAEDISSKDELDVKRYGVIVSKGYKRGLLLPNLEGVDTVDKQVDIALQKAGISGSKYEMQRFEVVRHK